MLTKQDLEQIEQVVDKVVDRVVDKKIDDAIKMKIKPMMDESIKIGFMDFFEHIFEPHQERSEAHHLELVREIRKLQKREDTQDEYIKEHDTRLTELEKIAKLKN